LASYFLSRTIVPTVAKYLLRGDKREAEDTAAIRNPLVRLQRRFEEVFERWQLSQPAGIVSPSPACFPDRVLHQ
jgi:multidrug efflux pump subunit AcrB